MRKLLGKWSRRKNRCGKETGVTTVDMFWERVNRQGAEDCWEWLAGKDKDGYGQFGAGYKESGTRRAHVFSFWMSHGNKPTHNCCHTCNNPGCVNPGHLYDGTDEENARDRVKAGNDHFSDPKWQSSIPRRRGTENNRSKLDDEKVREIRRQWEQSPRPKQRDLAQKYDVDQQVIWAVVNWKTWKHVT